MVSLVVGAAAMVFGVMAKFDATAISLGAGSLVTGAALTGFATVIELLERVAANTQRPGEPNPVSARTAQRIDPAVTAYFEKTGRNAPQ